jgi:hypothetical protein
MPSVFINYRRDDTPGYSGRIHDRLAALFGTQAVFMDLDDIRPGVNFVRAIEEGVAACEVMLVLIGKRWLDSRDSSGRRRIDNPEDFVRLEIAKGLERNVRVIPLLVNNASMPAEKDLPPELARLASIQAMQLSDERWEYDLGQLLAAIGGASRGSRTNRNRLIGTALAIVVLLGAVFAFMQWQAKPAPDFAGRWVADIQYDFGGRHSERFQFRTDSGNLSGVASFFRVDRGIVEGKVADDQISFTTRTEEIAGGETRQAQHHYRGRLVGDEIRFVMQTEGGFSDHPPIEFVAKRMPE